MTRPCDVPSGTLSWCTSFRACWSTIIVSQNLYTYTVLLLYVYHTAAMVLQALLNRSYAILQLSSWTLRGDYTVAGKQVKLILVTLTIAVSFTSLLDSLIFTMLFKCDLFPLYFLSYRAVSRVFHFSNTTDLPSESMVFIWVTLASKHIHFYYIHLIREMITVWVCRSRKALAR